VVVFIEPVIYFKAILRLVVFHEKVEPAVVFIIDPEYIPPAIAGKLNSRYIANIGKRTVAMAVKEQVALESAALLAFTAFSYVEVEVSVIVVIAEGVSVPVTIIVGVDLVWLEVTETAGFANIGKRAV
jgi:hypothetical protein